MIRLGIEGHDIKFTLVATGTPFPYQNILPDEIPIVVEPFTDKLFQVVHFDSLPELH